MEAELKELSSKQWFLCVLFIMPITFYLIELFFGDAQTTIASFVFYTFSSALGVMLGYVLFKKCIIKISHFKAFYLLVFIIVVLLVSMLSLLTSFLGFNQSNIIISKVVILSFSSSSFVFAFKCK